MLIRRLYTICLFVVSLCVNTAIAQHIESFSGNKFCPTAPVHPSVSLLAVTDSSWPIQKTEVITITQEEERSIFDEGGDAYIFNALRRIKSVDHYAGMGVKPSFSLVFEFHPPSFLQIALTPTVLPSMQSQWVARIPQSHNRLSGWKEGNLLYSHRVG
ncbi:hypothetical protein PTW35_08265 [Photobacterium sp. DA100]|uniref:hypothetical protein n=1 Tax=Photobacterium sp. DA100 TaxID=3027472 RepID=UPI0024784657|nr:hypothetical protein [Photobacterium sp. DA100]WEM43759.1 hypothetical protein PTW35_08265 [Photobacterium sp. DA100]